MLELFEIRPASVTAQFLLAVSESANPTLIFRIMTW